MMGLTARERDALAFIRSFIAENGGVGPSFDEIANAIGSRNRSSAHRVVAALESKRVVRRLHRRARSIEITTPPSNILDMLPAELAKRLAAYCAEHGERAEDVVADAVALHLDEVEIEGAQQ